MQLIEVNLISCMTAPIYTALYIIVNYFDTLTKQPMNKFPQLNTGHPDSEYLQLFVVAICLIVLKESTGSY